MSNSNIVFTDAELSCIHAAVTFEYSRLYAAIERGKVPADRLADTRESLATCDSVLSKLEEFSKSS